MLYLKELCGHYTSSGLGLLKGVLCLFSVLCAKSDAFQISARNPVKPEGDKRVNHGGVFN